jgi:hypothetical protein
MLAALIDARRPVNWKEFTLAFLLFLLLAYLYLGANILEGEIVAPMDVILEAEGWSELGLSLPAVSHLRGDILDAWLPRWIFTKRILLAGELPLWNPLVAGGQPALPSLPDSYFTPSFLLFCLFEDGIGFTLGLLIRLVLAGTGTYLLCRLFIGRLASFFAGMTFMMCGFNSSWLMWPQVATSAWIPWVLWSTMRLLQEPSCVRMTTVTLVTTAMIFGGFPAVAAYGLLLTGGLSLWFLAGEARKQGLLSSLRRSFWLISALLLSLPLAAIQLLPFVEYLHHVDLSWREGWGIPFSKIVLILAPFLEGQPHPEYCGYVGILATSLAFAAIFWVAPFKKCSGLLSPFFWALAALITLAIVYNQPAFLVNLIYQFPIFNFNQNGRMLALFGLEFAVLAGIGLHVLIVWIQSRLKRPLGRQTGTFLLAGFVLLCILHFLDLQRIGRSQNAVVPEETFYPRTRVIEGIQESLLPGQSVIHTYESFRNPGILTAYGVKDWFAHAHRLSNEKRLLGNLVEQPWIGPTAAVIFPEEIILSSPYFDLFSIRFVLVSALAVEGFSRPESHILLSPGETVIQSFTLDLPSIVNGVQVLTAAYGPGEVAECGLQAVLMREDKTQIAAQSTPKQGIRHHRWTTFQFDDEQRLEPGLYFLQLEAIGCTLAKPLVIGASPDSDRYGRGALVSEHKKASGDLAFRVLGIRPDLLKEWSLLSSDSPVTLLENREVPPGGFLVSSKEEVQFEGLYPIRWDGLQILRRERERVDYRVTCAESCWQVQSDRSWPGWRVYVDETESPVETVLGLFPGVQVPAGEHEIQWRYEPVLWSYGVKTTLLSLVFLVGLNIVARCYTAACCRAFN